MQMCSVYVCHAIPFIANSFYLEVTKRCEEVRFGTGLA